jgi:signal peptide peptidase SppA
MAKAHAIDRVLSAALYPWAITAPMLSVVAQILGHRLIGDALDVSALEKRTIQPPTSGTGVAVIPIHGVIAPRMNLVSEISGGATYEGAGVALEEAMGRRDIGTIVLDIDSPGGSVLGATEFAGKLRAARDVKPIIAHANFEMCSAAYWLAANATEIVASPSAVVGSIGVFSIHEDLSKALEQLGVKLTYISAGKFKVDGNEAEPLSESARAHLQAAVDNFYSAFVGDVAQGRGITQEAIRTGYGQGTSVTAAAALALGMVDSIATFEDTVARVLPSSTPALAQSDAPPVSLQRAAQARRAQQALMTLGL